MRIVKNTITEIQIELLDPNHDTDQKNSSDNLLLWNYSLKGTEEELTPLFSGSIWSAIVWKDSVNVMCEYLESHREEFRNKTIIELGCGLGVPGLVAGITCQAKQVYLTDRAQDLQVLSQSLTQNLPLRSLKFECLAFDWKDYGDDSFGKIQAEVVLAVECISADVYGKESLFHLLQAIKTVAKKETPILLFICSRRRKSDGLDFVLEKIEKCLMENSCIQLVAKSDEDGIELYKIPLFYYS